MRKGVQRVTVGRMVDPALGIPLVITLVLFCAAIADSAEPGSDVQRWLPIAIAMVVTPFVLIPFADELKYDASNHRLEFIEGRFASWISMHRQRKVFADLSDGSTLTVGTWRISEFDQASGIKVTNPGGTETVLWKTESVPPFIGEWVQSLDLPAGVRKRLVTLDVAGREVEWNPTHLSHFSFSGALIVLAEWSGPIIAMLTTRFALFAAMAATIFIAKTLRERWNGANRSWMMSTALGIRAAAVFALLSVLGVGVVQHGVFSSKQW